MCKKKTKNIPAIKRLVCVCVCVRWMHGGSSAVMTRQKKTFFQISVSAHCPQKQPRSLAAWDVADQGCPSSSPNEGSLLVRKIDPHAPQNPNLCSLLAPHRSPQVKGQGHSEDDPGQHEERQPGLQEGSAAGGQRRDMAVSDAPDRKHRV